MPDDGEPSKAATAASGGLYGGDRGAGGKFKRRERKPPSTPYDRPRGWISRFMDPAKRLLSDRATRLLPSLFSPSPIPDEVQTEVEQETQDQADKFSIDLVAPKSTVAVGPSDTKGKSKLNISDEDGLDRRGGHSDGGLPDVVQLINGKTFSREEIDHLMEILRSRVVDVEQERKSPSPIVQEEVERAQTSHEKQKASVEKEETDRFQLASSTPFTRPTMQDEIGASPVDIARAYMGSRISEVGYTPTRSTLKNDKLGLTSELPPRSLMPSPLSKEPICWPGAITQNSQGHTTPQSQKSVYGIHNFPRTPYSRAMYSKSKSKLIPSRGDSERFPNMSSTPLKSMGTPLYGKSLTNITEGSYGSGGPIRRTRNRFTSATPARESSLLCSVQRSPLAKELNSDLLKKKFEPGSSSTTKFQSVNSKLQRSEVGLTSVHPHSSKLARQILAQIDKPVTLKERSEELKLAASWKDSPTALATLAQNISSSGASGIGASRSMYVDDANLYAQTNCGNNALSQEKTDYAGSRAEKVVSGAMVTLEKSTRSGANDDSLPTLQKLDPQTKSSEQAINNDLSKSKSWFLGAQSKGLDTANNSTQSEPQNAQRKPVLPSIAISKPGLGTSFTSDFSAGFSFPVTASFSTFDLPTPTVVPSFLTSAPQQSNVSADHPTTGSKVTIAPPVFSFASTSTASTPSDALTPKFKFGSGKTRLSFALEGDEATDSPDDASSSKYKFGSGKSRLNFGLVGSDAVCC